MKEVVKECLIAKLESSLAIYKVREKAYKIHGTSPLSIEICKVTIKEIERQLKELKNAKI